MWTLVYFSVQAGGWRAAKMLHCLSLNKKVCVNDLVEDEGDDTQVVGLRGRREREREQNR